MSNSTSDKLVNNLNKIVTDCASISTDYQRKHGELLEIAGGFEKAVKIIKIQIKDYKLLINNLFAIIDNANILSMEDLNKMRIVQDETMANFKKLQITLDEYIAISGNSLKENEAENIQEIIKDYTSINKSLLQNNMPINNENNTIETNSITNNTIENTIKNNTITNNTIENDNIENDNIENNGIEDNLKNQIGIVKNSINEVQDDEENIIVDKENDLSKSINKLSHILNSQNINGQVSNHDYNELNTIAQKLKNKLDKNDINNEKLSTLPMMVGGSLKN